MAQVGHRHTELCLPLQSPERKEEGRQWPATTVPPTDLLSGAQNRQAIDTHSLPWLASMSARDCQLISQPAAGATTMSKRVVDWWKRKRNAAAWALWRRLELETGGQREVACCKWSVFVLEPCWGLSLSDHWGPWLILQISSYSGVNVCGLYDK